MVRSVGPRPRYSTVSRHPNRKRARVVFAHHHSSALQTFIILNRKFLVLNRKFLVFNAKFLVFTHSQQYDLLKLDHVRPSAANVVARRVLEGGCRRPSLPRVCAACRVVWPVCTASESSFHELCIQNHDFCIQRDDFCMKRMFFELKIMNFDRQIKAVRGEARACCAYSAHCHHLPRCGRRRAYRRSATG